jgi:hypothetical protein
MSSWAIVIGVDKYWREDACLKGAVNDALKFRTWVIEKAGVPEDHVFLLAGPIRDRELPPGTLRATRNDIIAAINQLRDRSGLEGERLYFYYAGHGLSRKGGEQALLPENFSDDDPQQSFDLKSLRTYFATTDFREQFFFIDACRNVPWDGDFATGEWPWRRDPPAGLRAPQQFVLLATSPGLKAVELREAGNERGAFTDALLQALGGDAQEWDPPTKQNVVRFNAAAKLVEKLVTEQQLAVADVFAHLIQIPRLDGERDLAVDPVLVRIPVKSTPVLSDAFNSLRMEVRRIEQLIQDDSEGAPLLRYASDIQNRFNPVLDQLQDRMTDIGDAIDKGELQRAWQLYGEVRSSMLPVLANDLLAAIGGLYLRDRALDDARLPAGDGGVDVSGSKAVSFAILAERILEDLVTRTGEAAPPVLIVGEERPDVTGAVIRLRFPAWDIWNLPLTAHEYGYILSRRSKVEKLKQFRHFVGRICNRLDPRSLDAVAGIDPPGYFSLDVKQFWKKYADRAASSSPAALLPRDEQHLVLLKDQQERLICRLFADTFATLYGGPAYLYSFLHLRFWPSSAVSWDMLPFPDRFVFGMQILERMNNEPGKPRKVFDSALTQLRQIWDRATVDANLESTYDDLATHYKEWVNELYACFLPYARNIDRTYDFFIEAQLLQKALRDPVANSSWLPVKRPNAWTVLNAAWLARAECTNESELNEMMRNSLTLLDKEEWKKLMRIVKAPASGVTSAIAQQV